MNAKTKWIPCGKGTLLHPVTKRAESLDVVELEGFGRIFEVFHYGNEPEQTQRLILAAPELLNALRDLVAAVHEYRLLDVKKRFSLCTADAQAGTILHKLSDI